MVSFVEFSEISLNSNHNATEYNSFNSFTDKIKCWQNFAESSDQMWVILANTHQ